MSRQSPPRVLANDFVRQWEDIREDALGAVDRVGHSGWLILGNEVEEFEGELAAWWGVEHAVGVASGLDALEIALRCAGLRPGERVLTTPLTAFATTLAILRAGGEPVWVDVDASGAMDLELADDYLSRDRSVRFVLPVHLYGHPMDPLALERLAATHDAILIEDCAQSAGATREDRPTGLAGFAAATSLYPTKNLGALGDGGIVLTRDPEVAKQARQLRDYGQAARYRHVVAGLNSRLDELHAAILRSAQLPRLDRWLRRRREIARRYDEELQPGRLQPLAAAQGGSAHHLYPVLVTAGDPAEAISRFADLGVVVGRHYPVLCPDQPAVSGVGLRVDALPTARQIAERELSLPMHPYLTDEEVERVIEACAELGR